MILTLSSKCSDLFWAELVDENGNVVAEHDGYVPVGIGLDKCEFSPGSDGKTSYDYVELDIDIKTGQILNWKPLTADDVKESFEKSHA